MHAMMNIRINKKEREVKCTLWKLPKSKWVLIIGPAMGVSRRFYSYVAEYFWQRSYSVIVFDYFGMPYENDSKRFSTLRLCDWGYKDLSMVIDYALKNFSGQDVFFLGHSIAGQILPLAKNSSKIKAAFLVASQNTSNSYWSGYARLKVNLFWYFIIPILSNTLGYIPGIAYGGKHKLHKSIARDWAKWGKSKYGLLSVDTKAKTRYRNFNPPVKFLSFSDDLLLAPFCSVEQLYRSYGSPYKYHEHLFPDRVGLVSIGHFNFFKKNNSFLWTKIDSWFKLVCSDRI